MNDLDNHREEQWNAALGEWGQIEPPADFSRRVVELSREERSRRPTSAGRTRVAIPILLAAVLVSFGAAAAWHHETREAEGSSRVEASPDEAPTPNRRTIAPATLVLHDSATAEEDPPDAAPEVKPGYSSASSASVTEEQPITGPPESPHPVPPGTVHLPRCSCGTSGIVCSCSE